MTLDAATLTAFVLVLARTSAWVLAAPVFSARGIPATGRLALSLALSLFLAPLAASEAALPTGAAEFGLLIVGQVLVGLFLGWLTGLVLSAFESAGAAIDIFSGFSAGVVFDPISGANAAVFARFSNLVFAALFFATNAYQTVVTGFVRSFQAVPAGSVPGFDSGGVESIARAFGLTLVAAIEIAAPVLGALFLTEVALGIAARFAPQANVFMIGLPLKVLVGLLGTGAALVFFPAYVDRLVDSSVRLGSSLIGG